MVIGWVLSCLSAAPTMIRWEMPLTKDTFPSVISSNEPALSEAEGSRNLNHEDALTERDLSTEFILSEAEGLEMTGAFVGRKRPLDGASPADCASRRDPSLRSG